MEDKLKQANEAIERAKEGGFFERWKDQLWEKTKRAELRTAVAQLVSPLLSGEQFYVRMEIDHRDVYDVPEGGPQGLTGDLEEAKDSILRRVWVDREFPKGYEAPAFKGE